MFSDQREAGAHREAEHRRVNGEADALSLQQQSDEHELQALFDHRSGVADERRGREVQGALGKLGHGNRQERRRCAGADRQGDGGGLHQLEAVEDDEE